MLEMTCFIFLLLDLHAAGGFLISSVIGEKQKTEEALSAECMFKIAGMLPLIGISKMGKMCKLFI